MITPEKVNLIVKWQKRFKIMEVDREDWLKTQSKVKELKANLVKESEKTAALKNKLWRTD